MEQREDPSLSNDPFVWDNTASNPQDDRQWDRDGPPLCNQGQPQYGGYACSANNSQPAVRAINVEEFRAEDYYEGSDNGKSDGGRGDMGFDPTDL